MKAPVKENALWLSRTSFLLSGIALVSVGYRSVSERFWGDPATALQTSASQATTDSSAQPRGAAKLVGAVRDHVSHVLSIAREHQPDLTSSLALQRSASAQNGVSSSLTADESEAEDATQEAGRAGSAVSVRVKRLVVTQAVEDREPVEVGEVSSSTPVIAFVEVATDGGQDQRVVVTFEHETGDRAGLVNLNVPGNKSRWRTWGRTYDVNRDGRWTAVVRDSRGEELGRTAFTVRGTS